MRYLLNNVSSDINAYVDESCFLVSIPKNIGYAIVREPLKKIRRLGETHESDLDISSLSVRDLNTQKPFYILHRYENESFKELAYPQEYTAELFKKYSEHLRCKIKLKPLIDTPDFTTLGYSEHIKGLIVYQKTLLKYKPYYAELSTSMYYPKFRVKFNHITGIVVSRKEYDKAKGKFCFTGTLNTYEKCIFSNKDCSKINLLSVLDDPIVQSIIFKDKTNRVMLGNSEQRNAFFSFRNESDCVAFINRLQKLTKNEYNEIEKIQYDREIFNKIHQLRKHFGQSKIQFTVPERPYEDMKEPSMRINFNIYSRVSGKDNYRAQAIGLKNVYKKISESGRVVRFCKGYRKDFSDIRNVLNKYSPYDTIVDDLTDDELVDFFYANVDVMAEIIPQRNITMTVEVEDEKFLNYVKLLGRMDIITSIGISPNCIDYYYKIVKGKQIHESSKSVHC